MNACTTIRDCARIKSRHFLKGKKISYEEHFVFGA